MAKVGLYERIRRKRARIKAGSGERMRKPGSKGAPTAKAFRQSAKTAKKRKQEKVMPQGKGTYGSKRGRPPKKTKKPMKPKKSKGKQL